MLNAYPLNLPDLKHVVNDIQNLEKFKTNTIHYVKSNSIVKENFINLLNFKFEHATVFYKVPNFSSRIHIDHDQWTKEGPNKFVWGINWNYGGSGIYKFWKENDIDSYSTEINPRGRKHVLLNSSAEPYETYIHYHGAVLFNATLPHQIKNIGSEDRFSISIRTSLSESSWQEVIKKFEPLIDTNLKNLERVF